MSTTNIDTSTEVLTTDEAAAILRRPHPPRFPGRSPAHAPSRFAPNHVTSVLTCSRSCASQRVDGPHLRNHSRPRRSERSSNLTPPLPRSPRALTNSVLAVSDLLRTPSTFEINDAKGSLVGSW